MFSGPAKGQIDLSLNLNFNLLKAAFNTFQPRNVNYTKRQPRFRVSTMKHNARRISLHTQPLKDAFQQLEYSLDWQSTLRSVAALSMFVAGVLLFEPFMLTTILLLFFLKNFITYKLRSRNNNEEVASVSCDDVAPGENNSKAQKKSLADKWQSIQEMCLTVQEIMNDIASLFERINNLMMWRVPWLSWLAVLMLILVTVVFYLVHLRFIILVWGLIHFTRKLRRPHSIHHSGVLDFLLRVPSNRQLFEYSYHHSEQREQSRLPTHARETRKQL